jgi:hypothetical protein
MQQVAPLFDHLVGAAEQRDELAPLHSTAIVALGNTASALAAKGRSVSMYRP